MASTRSTSRKQPAPPAGRLPRHIRPTRYGLTMAPDLVAGTFDGEAVITLLLTRSTREILLNAVDLTLSEAWIGRPHESAQRGRVRMLPAHEQCRITVPRSLGPGSWELRVRFRGRLNEHLHGFYRSTYTDEQGAQHILAVTQFEAADARRAFPCWDEPDFKAVFSLTLIADRAMATIANTEIVSERIDGEKKHVRFADTIVMSTYLLAFVVGRMEATTPTFVGKTPIRTWTVPGKARLASYGQELAGFALRFFEDYYGIPYPGDKLDLIAIPDFSHGAMENLGAITFRESALLIDPARATYGELEGLADVVCHEIAHMWFGDLVTMSWWNGLWLNEAFATFLEVVAVDAWKPEWQRWDRFALARGAALSTDGLFASRPIEFPVYAVKDLGAMFDVLTYQKGAAILRMFEQFLGATVFRDGVRQYLHAHAYGNAETTDLWNALAEASRQPVADIMHGWVFSPGYPLLVVSLNRDRQLVIRQQRFTYLASSPEASQNARPVPTRWRVPLQLSVRRQGESAAHRVLLDKVETLVAVQPDFETALLNPGGHGYYRVHYSPELRARLLARLDDALSPIDRFNLINDAWATCLAGILSLREYLAMMAHFTRDRSPHVWSVLLFSFERIERILSSGDRPVFESWVRDQLSGAVTDLGWTPRSGENDLTRELRADLISTMGTLGNDPATQRAAKELYAITQRDPEAVDPNLVPALIKLVAFIGDETEYRDFASRFRGAANPQEERRYLFSLTAFRSPALVTRTLASTLNGDIRTQDGASVIGALLSTRHGRDLAWNFIKENWKTLSVQFPANGLRRLFGHLPALATPELERDVRHFIERHRIDLGGKALSQYLEQLRVAVEFGERERASLHAYLSSTARPD